MTNEKIRPPHAAKRARSLVLGALLAAAFSVHANGLGDISVKSHLGERLRVEIQLRGNETSPRGPECFHLSTALAENSGLPRLNHAGMNVLANPPRLVITSRDSVFEPAIELAVFYGCGVYLSRSYTVLLSPREAIQPISAPLAAANADPTPRTAPETKARPPVARRTRQLLPGETPEDMAQRLYPRSENYRRRFLRELIALNPDRLSDATTDQPLSDGSGLKIPPPIVPVKKPAPPPTAMPEAAATDKREAAPSQPPAAATEPAPTAAKATAAPADRLVLSAPPEEAPGALPQVTPEQAQIEMDQRLRDVIGQSRALSTELAAMQREFPNPPAEVQTRLLEMETRLARMELAAVRIKLSMAQAQAGAATTPPPPTSPAAAPATDAAAPAAAPAGEPAPTPATPPAVPAAVAEKPAAAAPVAEEGSSGFWWGLGVLLAFAAALAAYLTRNSTRRGENGPLSILMPTKMSSAAKDAAGDMAAKPALASAVGKPAAAPVDDLDRPEPPPEFERSMPGEVEIVEVAHVLAIFGRTPAAIEVLAEFIAQNPDKALNPSLYLLKLYKQTDKRDDFKSLAAKLHADFNVLEVSWDDPIEDMVPLEPSARDYREVAKELEKIPHIYSRISEQWGSRECLDYLHDLLHNNRSGQRHGLPLAATNEVLNLIAMLQRELPAATATGKS